MMDGLEAIGGSGHPWEKRLFDVNIALNEIQVSPPSTMEGLL
jgi:hypothetical protein